MKKLLFLQANPLPLLFCLVFLIRLLSSFLFISFFTFSRNSRRQSSSRPSSLVRPPSPAPHTSFPAAHGPSCQSVAILSSARTRRATHLATKLLPLLFLSSSAPSYTPRTHHAHVSIDLLFSPYIHVYTCRSCCTYVQIPYRDTYPKTRTHARLRYLSLLRAEGEFCSFYPRRIPMTEKKRRRAELKQRERAS